MSTAEDIRDIWKEVDSFRDMRVTFSQTKHLLEGNGMPPLSVRLERLEAHVRDMQKLKWVIVGSIVATILGIASTTYTTSRATAASASSAQEISKVLGEVRGLAREVKNAQ